MDIKRVILGAALAMLAYSLWTAWQVDYPKGVVLSQPSSTYVDKNHTSSEFLPTLSEKEVTRDAHQESLSPVFSQAQPDAQNQTTTNQRVEIKTDVFNLSIDLAQGDIISADLLNYSDSGEVPNNPFSLLSDKPGSRYVANSNLLVVKNNAIEPIKPNFKSQKQHYQLLPHQEQLKVVLEGKTESGLLVKKEFIFKRGSYLIELRYTFMNEGSESWTGYVNTQLMRDLPKEDKTTLSHIGSYTGASYSNPPHHRYQKLTFKEMSKTALDVDVESGWIAMQQRYFLTAWIPTPDTKARFYSRTHHGSYAIGAVSQAIKLQPSDKQTFNTQLYLGPEIANQLKSIAPGLDLTIDYGWLWFISAMLFSIMKMIYSFVGNWGWSIVLVTVLVKLFFYRLSAKSYRSMANMRQLQPKLQALREKYGHDKVKISQETMALYREEKVNPLSGCLPMLIQLPIFMALYWVLVESVELRQAPFVLWIQDLASPDPYHVLTLLMGASMFIQQKLNPAPPDPMQAKMMMLLPVLFTVMFWNLPSGLTLYWTVNNTLTILQQWYITRKFGDKK